MNILVAFDKFKGALTATEACQRVAAGLQQTLPKAAIHQIPLTDGGDGFVEILTRSAQGERFDLEVEGPDGQPVQVQFGIVNAAQLPEPAQQFLNRSHGKIALVEMAQTTGLASLSLSSRNPWKTHSYGLGQVLAHLARSGIRDILLGVGGSATQDLGLAALVPLGLRCKDSTGTLIERPTPETWEVVDQLEWTPLFRDLNIRLACDVDNPLLGERGTAAVFACQKGLPEQDIPQLENATAGIAAKIETQLGVSPEVRNRAGSGAAGGIGYGFQAILNSTLLSGAELIECWFRLTDHIRQATHVFTGEGRADSGTLEGKGPGMILKLAEKQGVPLYFLAGQVEPGLEAQTASQTRLIAISPDSIPVEEAMRDTAKYLEEAVSRLAVELKQQSSDQP